MNWDNTRILQELRKLHRQGQDLSYNAACRTLQPIVSAAAYHFGSYRKAIEKAGIDYADVVRRPRWTKPLIVETLKKASRKGEDLHWSAVTRRRDDLGKAAFASLQPRLFGSWDLALKAAGLDPDEVSRYRSWTPKNVTAHLRELHRQGKSLNSGAIQKTDPGLHAAAIRYFENYDKALQAAKLNPASVRKRRNWTTEEIISSLKAAKRAGQSLSGSSIRDYDIALYGAAIRLFGSFTNARKAAGLTYSRTKKKTAK